MEAQNYLLEAYFHGIAGDYMQYLRHLITAVRLDESNMLTWCSLLNCSRFLLLTILKRGKWKIKQIISAIALKRRRV